MKIIYSLCLSLCLFVGCTRVVPISRSGSLTSLSTPSAQSATPPVLSPAATTDSLTLPTTKTPAPRTTATRERPATPTVFPTPFAGTLMLVARKNFEPTCALDLPKLASEGLDLLAFVPTGDCPGGKYGLFQNGELGLFQIGAHTYIAQSGLFSAAFTLTDVTNPAVPRRIGTWDLPPESHTYDLKAFHQGDRYYLALGLQRSRKQADLPCGIVIVEVTDVQSPKLVTRLDGRSVGAPEPWCNVHTLEIDTDAPNPEETPGSATYIIVSDVDTFSARAVDIRDLQHPREVNFYHLHAHLHVMPDQSVVTYVHDSYIGPTKIYLAYWLAGVVILDKQKFEAGVPQNELNPVIIKPTENVQPGGFLVHYTVPIANGDFLFIQDELNADNGLRLLDIRDPEHVKTVWTETNPRGVNAPHNFVIRYNLLVAGWYNDGVKVFRFDVSNPDSPSVHQIAFQEVRANKIITRENYFDGIWGVRVNDCLVQDVRRLCIYASDLSAGLLVLALKP